MIRVVVESIRVSLLTQHRVVVLRETDSRRYLPIWIGAPEADAISMAIQGFEPQRPMTHDLLKAVISDLGATIVRIVINDMQESTFYARIVVDQHGRTIEIDSRPSDALALAVRSDAPIFVAEHVISQVGVLVDEDDESNLPAPSTPEPTAPREASPPAPAPAASEPDGDADLNDDTMSIFRNFINTLKVDDPKKDDPDQSSKS